MSPLEKLREKLLKIGGTSVRYIAHPDTPWPQHLFEHGIVLDGDSQIIAGIKPDECHGNTLGLFLFTNKTIGVWNGYALAPDNHANTGIWSAHTWAVHEKTIVETTPLPRKIYFGCPHPNPLAWAEDELKTKNLWRDHPVEYIEFFRSEYQEAARRLAGVWET
jgi:hypothetical protein